MLYLQQLKLHVSQRYHHFTNVGPTNPDSSHSFSQHWHLWQYFWPNIDRLRWRDVIWFIVRRNCYRLVRCCLNAFSLHYYANIIPTILFQVSRWTIVGPACFKVLASFNSLDKVNSNTRTYFESLLWFHSLYVEVLFPPRFNLGNITNCLSGFYTFPNITDTNCYCIVTEFVHVQKN